METEARTLSELEDLATALGQRLLARRWMLVTAESCTGGWVAQAATAVAGSSRWFERGLVSYSNQAKQDLLGVSPATLAAHGAVSEATAREMALGALARSPAQVSVAVTGIAGPDGGTPDKPVGTVCFAWASAGGELLSARHRFAGDREAVRRQSVAFALEGLAGFLDRLPAPA